MNGKQSIFFTFVFLFVSLNIYSSSPRTEVKYSINNVKEVLKDRVKIINKPLKIQTTDGKKIYPKALTLTLIAEVAAPTVNSKTVQANSIDIDGNTAFVSYNTKGDERCGAIQAIDLSSILIPSVSSEVLFDNADVNETAKGNGDYIYAALAHEDEIYTAPALLFAIEFTNDAFDTNTQEFLQLGSFAATSVVYNPASNLFATSGDTGSLYAISNAPGMSILDSVNLTDARWVTYEDTSDQRVVALQGTSGQISVFEYSDDEFALSDTFSFTGATDSEAKSTVEVVGEKAFIGAGSDGVKVLSINTGDEVGSIPVPTDTGFPDSDVVTNAVSVDGDLMFVSNGAAGVYIYQGDEDFEDSDSEDDLDLTELGKIVFDDNESINHLKYENGHLIVASGSGGVKIVEVLITLL